MSIKNKVLSRSNQFNYYKKETARLKNEEKLREDEFKEDEIREKYEDGISVIIPSYNGENHIDPLLDSLAKQTLSPEKFELIFVINGDLDGTVDKLSEFIQDNSELNVVVNYTSRAGVSNARNIGLAAARREYVTFIDDDDFVSPSYLNSLYKYSQPNRVVMTNFIDIDIDTGEEIESPAVPFSFNKHGIVNAYTELKSLVAVTVAKTIPTHAAKSVRFNTNLKNGVDISYYCRLYPKFDFEFYFIDKKEKAIYYRIRTSESLSRQEISYEFNIIHKLRVIEDIDFSLKYAKGKKNIDFLKLRVNATSSFIVKYVRAYPEDKQKVLDEIRKHEFIYFPYEKIENIE